MNNTTKIIIGALLIIAIAGYGGFKLGQSKSPNNRGQFNLAGGPSSQGGMKSGVRGGAGFGGGMLSGDILKKDSQSLTLQLREGGSKIVWFATSTEISKVTTGSVDDLFSGKTITVNGTANPDGSIVAKTIQLRPNPLTRR
ncbi:MAG: hypothetical protein WCV68_01495 [Candidatus Paceibacterota bacterium]|jgi:hypothetical protein